MLTVHDPELLAGLLKVRHEASTELVHGVPALDLHQVAHHLVLTLFETQVTVRQARLQHYNDRPQHCSNKFNTTRPQHCSNKFNTTMTDLNIKMIELNTTMTYLKTSLTGFNTTITDFKIKTKFDAEM